MRWLLIPLTLTFATPAVGAQGADTLDAPRLTPVEQAAVAIHNAAGTRRVLGSFVLAAGETRDGDVAVLNGPVTVAGTLRGTLVAINADVRLAPGARITRDLVVVGGTVAGRDSAVVEGETRLQPELLRYRLEGERLIPEETPRFDDSWWRWHRRQRDGRAAEEARDVLDFTVRTGGTYNRVEGLPVLAGPSVRKPTPWGMLRLDALAIVRTAAPVRWGRPTVGHDVRSELQVGKRLGAVVGARLFDVVDAVEDWQVPAGEAGMAAFLARRDYRDWYGRHGGQGYLSLRGGSDADLTVGLSHERWASMAGRAPVTWGDVRGWRPNAAMDEGTMRLLTTQLRADSRERERSAWSGWYFDVQWERGQGRLAPPRPAPGGDPAATREVTYTRGLVDVRRYNRLGPDAHLNLRAVLGGWLSGDALPRQRRVSLGGPFALSGYDFREAPVGTTDDLTCARGPAVPGQPAQCDRVMLLQAEFRWGFPGSGWRRGGNWWDIGWDGEPAFVLFSDAGKGWLVGSPDASGLRYERGSLPGWGALRTSIGAGVDFGGIGFYLAKAVKDGGEPVRGFIRLQRRI